MNAIAQLLDRTRSMAKRQSGKAGRAASTALPHRERELIRKMESILTELEACRIVRAPTPGAARDMAAALARETLEMLKTERSRQGLSLADVRTRSGIERSALCKLENTQTGNPTLKTLSRYAAALGKRLRISLEDDGPGSA